MFGIRYFYSYRWSRCIHIYSYYPFQRIFSTSSILWLLSWNSVWSWNAIRVYILRAREFLSKWLHLYIIILSYCRSAWVYISSNGTTFGGHIYIIYIYTYEGIYSVFNLIRLLSDDHCLCYMQFTYILYIEISTFNYVG